MKRKIIFIVVIIWFILWANFILRDLFKRGCFADYRILVKRNGEGKKAHVYGDRFYEFLKHAKAAIARGNSYKLIGIDHLSLAHRRAIYYLYPLLENDDPNYMLDAEHFTLKKVK